MVEYAITTALLIIGIGGAVAFFTRAAGEGLERNRDIQKHSAPVQPY